MPRLILKIVRRQHPDEAATPKVVARRGPYNDDDIILLLRKHEDLKEPITANDPDILKIPLGLLKKHPILLRDLFEKRIDSGDPESLKKVVYGPRQDPAKRFMTEPGIYIETLVNFVIANKVIRYGFIEHMIIWDIFVGVRAWLEWAKMPGYLWNGNNIYVVAMSLPVAEWLGASEEFKSALLAQKMLLERDAPVRGIRP